MDLTGQDMFYWRYFEKKSLIICRWLCQTGDFMINGIGVL